MNKNLKIVLIAFISFIIASVIVLLMDFDLIKTLYELYYGDSDITIFFEEQGQNIFTTDVRITTFKLIISRTIYTIIPIACSLFIGIYYHSKALSEKTTNHKIFQNNPSLSKILNICRYLTSLVLVFFIISNNRSFINSTFHNCLLGNKPDFVRIICASLLALIPIMEWKTFIFDVRSFPQRHKKLVSISYIILVSIISCCLVEFQIGSKMSIVDYLLHINIMYWIILQILFLGIFRNIKPGAILSLVFSYVIGLANDIVYQFRGNYIMFGDITVVRTALEVAGNYTYKPNFWFWTSLILLIVALAITILVKIPKDAFISKNLSRRIVSTIIVEVFITTFVVITFKSGDFYGKVFGVGWNYNDNVSVVGYLPYFFSNMDSTTRIMVDDYSSSEVEEILNKYDNVNEATTSVYPNIILIQNEAFSDISITADIMTDNDPLSYIHSMSENTEKGYLNMSNTGGPTSNTEFEILSRCSLQFFPYGSVPYTQYLKQHIPSMVEVLKNQSTPYHTVAYHSYYSSGYNRNSVYTFMGFDEKLFENNFMSDYPTSDLPRGYLSDEANYRRVINAFEKNQKTNNPFFCFNVTIQGHGGYTGGPYNLKENVNVTNFAATDSLNTYLSCIKMSDTAFKNLIEYFREVNEPTIIMMYGDHQPSFDDETKELLDQHPAWNEESLQTLSQFYVPYIIWANYDIEESDSLKPWNESAEEFFNNRKNKDVKLNTLSTNYVSSYLMSKAGVELSSYDNFLLELHEDIPAVTAIGLWDKEGNYYDSAESSNESEKMKELEKIQYNLIFDADNKQEKDFLP